ncbi:MAG TPA: heme exporter protein CcmB [Gemmatimonadales bacterium]|nr:heme exporter protein CcmB [Gemmatimonadales bacterium]
MSGWRAAVAIAGKDLRIERRSRTALLTASTFAVLIQLVFVFARDTATTTLAMVAPSVLWITMALTSLLALNRAFLLEREHAAMEGILLAPVPRAALFWGKWLGNLAFVALVQLLAFLVWVLFFNVAPSLSLLLVFALTLAAAAGFTAAGTLLAAMTARTRHAELLLPVLLLPFLVPPVFAGAQATMRLLAGRPMDELAGWLRLLVVYDVAFLVLATLLFPIVVDE